MRNVAKEGARRGIRANTICRACRTPSAATIQCRPAVAKRLGPVTVRAMATGWEIAYAALFFISDESVYVQRPDAGGRQRYHRVMSP